VFSIKMNCNQFDWIITVEDEDKKWEYKKKWEEVFRLNLIETSLTEEERLMDNIRSKNLKYNEGFRF
jgi:hypothetical protein